MTTSQITARKAELDNLISMLHEELDACPNSRWDSEGNQYRLGLLIEYTAKLKALEAMEGSEEPDTTDPTPTQVDMVAAPRPGFSDAVEVEVNPDFPEPETSATFIQTSTGLMATLASNSRGELEVTSLDREVASVWDLHQFADAVADLLRHGYRLAYAN